MTRATLYSGIGAPEAACPWIEWLWCAEIERFPCAVLEYRHPRIPNLGDVTDDTFTRRAAAFGPVDILVAGFPCQDFSVAGGRAGMAGARGSLAIRSVDLIRELRPAWLLLENVPGLLSSASHEAPDPHLPDNLSQLGKWQGGDRYDADEGSDFGVFEGLDGLFYRHESVNHSAGEYARGAASTNSIESVWAVLKRGIHGVYHQVSPKHLHRYVDEFTFRLNEGDVKRHTLRRLESFIDAIVGKRLTYARLIAPEVQA